MVTRETAYDYDNCTYFIIRDEDSKLLKFAFSCNCTKQILASGGQDMLRELYSGNTLSIKCIIKCRLYPA